MTITITWEAVASCVAVLSFFFACVRYVLIEPLQGSIDSLRQAINRISSELEVMQRSRANDNTRLSLLEQRLEILESSHNRLTAAYHLMGGEHSDEGKV